MLMSKFVKNLAILKKKLLVIRSLMFFKILLLVRSNGYSEAINDIAAVIIASEEV